MFQCMITHVQMYINRSHLDLSVLLASNFYYCNTYFYEFIHCGDNYYNNSPSNVSIIISIQKNNFQEKALFLYLIYRFVNNSFQTKTIQNTFVVCDIVK